jgi:hypothetical protein
MTLYEEKFGPMVMAKAALGEQWAELRSDMVSLFDSWNIANDWSCRIEAEYLVTVGRKRRT